MNTSSTRMNLRLPWVLAISKMYLSPNLRMLTQAMSRQGLTRMATSRRLPRKSLLTVSLMGRSRTMKRAKTNSTTTRKRVRERLKERSLMEVSLGSSSS